MLCSRGVFFSRFLFVVINMMLVLSWAIQLAEGDRKKVKEAEIREEVRWWDGEIVRLEELMWRREVGESVPLGGSFFQRLMEIAG
jgi:hypothetical protein